MMIKYNFFLIILLFFLVFIESQFHYCDKDKVVELTKIKPPCKKRNVEVENFSFGKTKHFIPDQGSAFITNHGLKVYFNHRWNLLKECHCNMTLVNELVSRMNEFEQDYGHCPSPCVNGTDGVNGIDGINGIDGKNGTDGKNGINGINGLNGKDCNMTIVNELNSKILILQNWVNNFHCSCVNGTNGQNGQNGQNGIDGINANDTYIIEVLSNQIAAMSYNDTELKLELQDLEIKLKLFIKRTYKKFIKVFTNDTNLYNLIQEILIDGNQNYNNLTIQVTELLIQLNQILTDINNMNMSLSQSCPNTCINGTDGINGLNGANGLDCNMTRIDELETRMNGFEQNHGNCPNSCVNGTNGIDGINGVNGLDCNITKINEISNSAAMIIGFFEIFLLILFMLIS